MVDKRTLLRGILGGQGGGRPGGCLIVRAAGSAEGTLAGSAAPRRGGPAERQPGKEGIVTMEARVGIIGGNGWLGNAIAQATVAAGAVDPARLTLSGRSDDRGAMEIPGAHWTKDNGELVDRSDVVVLSVRPDQFQGVHVDARGKLVVSVMAGVPAHTIAERTGAEEVVRSIPNAAAGIRRSFTPWYATPPVSTESKRLVQTLFEACGEPPRCRSKPTSTIASG